MGEGAHQEEAGKRPTGTGTRPGRLAEPSWSSFFSLQWRRWRLFPQRPGLLRRNPAGHQGRQGWGGEKHRKVAGVWWGNGRGKLGLFVGRRWGSVGAGGKWLQGKDVCGRRWRRA
ncbi:hypothetical protein E2562_031151 [Oryza meyeriana var. granulata]|uniref:Uncharacterized protein n=1 Tax=Oryza meyeriana var. granulata TaxID=110450 RepID=A0A6G1FED5_9ORYZ|nr:hypothetical protein E2562_031151 [Oryza meyeriana var. granulata]